MVWESSTIRPVRNNFLSNRSQQSLGAEADSQASMKFCTRYHASMKIRFMVSVTNLFYLSGDGDGR